MPEVTPAQKTAAIEVIAIVADAIRELGTVPSGHLYGSLMGFMSLNSYEMIIEKLINLGYITRSNHLITWVGKAK